MLTIRKKDDLIIPFENIGDQDWDLKTREILEARAALWDAELIPPIPLSEIEELEKRLGTTLPEGLKLFYLTFGLADIGEQLQNFQEIGWIKDIWKKEPQYGPDFTPEDQQFLPFMVSFSDYLGNGNMFCFHSETKEIYYYDHDDSPYLSKLFDRVDSYLKGCLIFAQSELEGEELTQETIEEWAEEINVGFYGEKVCDKWRY